MQVTNLAYFFDTARKVRGGKWVWVKDSNGEGRKNVLLGGTILNPNKGFGHLWAAQLVQYTPAEGCLIFRSFEVAENAAANATSIKINGDGYSDVPEVGQLLMVAPDAVDTTGQSAVVTAVEYNRSDSTFTVTLSTALGALEAGTILVEADGETASAEASVLVTNPNTFIEADRDMLPTEGYGVLGDTNYSISTVHDKEAWIARMQPLPKYVLAKNRSYIEGIFWI